MLKRRSLKLLYLPLLLVAACAPANASKTAAVRDMTVCQLYASRQSPPKEKVRIIATAWMDLGHGAMLQDSKCPPGATIDFRFAEHLPAHSTASKFDQALTGDVMNRSLRIFQVQVIGRFSAASQSNTHGMFYIEQVDWFKQQLPSPSH